MKFKKPIAHLCYDLINGKTVSIKTGFNDYGITNIPREISRAVEQRFGVVVDKQRKKDKTKYGFPVTWFEYKLIRSRQPKEALEKIYAYIDEWMIKPTIKKSGKPGFTQGEMF